jgi:hypothetical protein
MIINTQPNTPSRKGLWVKLFFFQYKESKEIPKRTTVSGNKYSLTSERLTPNAPRRLENVLMYSCVQTPPLQIIIMLDKYVSTGVVSEVMKPSKPGSLAVGSLLRDRGLYIANIDVFRINE